VPGDKSIAHRALLLGAAARGVTHIGNFEVGADNRSTMGFIRALGVSVRETPGEVHVGGCGWDGFRAPEQMLDCGNSGTTMRLGIGLLAGQRFQARLTGDASLCRRPMARVIEPMRAMGARVESEPGGCPPLVVRGGSLHGISYRLPVASAQVKSAVLIAGLQAQGETVVIEPEPTRDHTERLMASFGAPVRVDRDQQGAAGAGRRILVSGGGSLRAASVTLPGDFSSAAFFLVAAVLVGGSDLVVSDVGLNPTRTALLDVLKAMGASFEIQQMTEQPSCCEPVGTVRVRSSVLRGVTVAPELIPRLIDEVPLLCVAAACAEGVTRITGARELRVKESDRIAVMACELRDRGVSVEELPDGLVIEGKGPVTARRPFPLHGGTAKSHGDHRVAMAMAVAGLASNGGLCIDDAEVAEVSFPGFYARLGGLIG
jgi:3-phosphoshikimate 1-carboxyvinyltransferase